MNANSGKCSVKWMIGASNVINGGLGTMIAYASGPGLDSDNLGTTVVAGEVSTGNIIGFGNNYDFVPYTNSSDPIILNASDPFHMPNCIFCAPRNCVINNFYASYTATAGSGTIIGDLTVTAQIYTDPSGTGIFTPVTGSLISFTSITVATPVGTTETKSQSLINVPVMAGTRVMVFYAAEGNGQIRLAESAGINFF